MARPLVIGNGRLLIGFDEHLILRDLYYPRVGQVNQIVGRHNQLGVWVDGLFAWLSEETWATRLGYRPASLVTESVAVHDGLDLVLTLRDGVHPRTDILLRQVTIRNLQDRARQVRLFATFDFDIDGSDIGDTAYWDPTQGTVCHYKRNRWFLISGQGPAGGIDQYATGRKRFQGAEGTWRDAEDGQLEGHPISQGSVDSTIGLSVLVGPNTSETLWLWVVVANGYDEAKAGHHRVTETGAEHLFMETERYWRSWAGRRDFLIETLPSDLQAAYHRSLLIVRTQVDEGGAILAANDSDILQCNRDHYSYMWPRDGAFVAGALDRAGCSEVTRRFYTYCQRVLSPEGFFWHKYNPDGTTGSSWHPWVGMKGVQLPIQEDETALVLWALGQHFRLTRELEEIRDLYAKLVQPAAEFLIRYRDERTRLPLESYDLWEERRGILTFTVAAVVAGLAAAAELAGAMGDRPAQERYRTAADETRQALLDHLWSDRLQRFLRGIYLHRDGSRVPDDTAESSIMGLFLLGVLPPEDPRMVATAQYLEEALRVKTRVGGIARYYDDYYFRVAEDPEVVPGNPWVICTLWLARWHIARAQCPADLERAEEAIRWALAHALPGGALPEQIHPLTGAALSVAPLTWSHATMVDVLLDLAARKRELS